MIDCLVSDESVFYINGLKTINEKLVSFKKHAT
jgi:hypothetical protein